jgi:3',5'-cyclic AMP phosphodiesterase CpdA
MESPLAEFCPPASIVLLGDSRPHAFLELWRNGPRTIREEIIERIARERPALILHSGDLVTSGASSSAWARFDHEMAPLRQAKIPFFPALGNHEYAGKDETALQNFFARFPLLDGRRWYELRMGPVLVLVLDTNWSALSPGLRSEQDAWYWDQLWASDLDPSIRAVFVLGHHPPFTNAVTHQPDVQSQAHLVEPARGFRKVRLFISGHAHTYERFFLEDKLFVVSGGGGAPLAPLGVKTRSPRQKDEFSGGVNRPFNYLLVTVEESRAKIGVMMLREKDRTWYQGDSFTVEF